MTTEDIVARLDRTNAILQLAHYGSIVAARERIRSDKTNAAILELAAAETVKAGTLIAAVKEKTGDSKATIGRRIGALVDQGALERIGAGPSTAYKATGLV